MRHTSLRWGCFQKRNQLAFAISRRCACGYTVLLVHFDDDFVFWSRARLDGSSPEEDGLLMITNDTQNKSKTLQHEANIMVIFRCRGSNPILASPAQIRKDDSSCALKLDGTNQKWPPVGPIIYVSII